jgi:large subunit ribosomal protein L32e
MKKELLNKIKLMRYKYKSKKPKFLRYHWNRYYRLERQDTWKRPRGKDNKSRLRLKGYPPPVDPGYRKPKIIRYLHSSGLIAVKVNNINELEKITNKEDKIVVISSSVGFKKKLEIIKRAKELGVKIANGGKI